MSQTGAKLRRQGYALSGTETQRTLLLRHLFLAALVGEEDARQLVDSYIAMKPVAEAANRAWLRAIRASPPWQTALAELPEDVREEVSESLRTRRWYLTRTALTEVLEALNAPSSGGPQHSTVAALSEPERDALRNFWAALRAWMSEYGLNSEWFYTLAVSNLCTRWDGHLDVFRQDSVAIRAFQPPRDFAFRTFGYDGFETPSEFARRVGPLFDHALRRHLDSTTRRFRHREAGVPVGFIDRRTRSNVRLCAMWQISNWTWSAFVESHELIESRSKLEQTAEELRRLLREIGLEPRAGLGASHTEP